MESIRMRDTITPLASNRSEHRAATQHDVHAPGAGKRGIRKSLERFNAPPSMSKYSEMHALFEAHSFDKHFQPGSTILLHGDPADAVYLVVSGTVRCCTVDAEGHRQIFTFTKRGEFLGLSDLVVWHFTAESVDHVIVKSLPRTTLEQALAVNLTLREEVRAHISALLQRREKQLLALISSKGWERLYEFLKDFAASRSGDGYIALPMCRRDIGDHIGLSMESVSRAFTELKRRGLIDLHSHEKYKITGDL